MGLMLLGKKLASWELGGWSKTIGFKRDFEGRFLFKGYFGSGGRTSRRGAGLEVTMLSGAGRMGLGEQEEEPGTSSRQLVGWQLVGWQWEAW